MLKSFLKTVRASDAEFWDEYFSIQSFDYLVDLFDSDPLHGLFRKYCSAGTRVLEGGCGLGNYLASIKGLGGRPIGLTAREYQLLEFLLRNKNRVLSRGVIYDRVWSGDFTGTLKIVDVYVNYLRSKVDEDFQPKLLQTVRGVGYVLREETHAS